MGRYIDTLTGGGQALAVAQLKYNIPISTHRRRRGSQVLHLGQVKVEMVEIDATFVASMNGTRVDPGEFIYESPDKYLYMTNLDSASGMGISEGSGFAIPINYVEREAIILSNVYNPPEII